MIGPFSLFSSENISSGVVLIKPNLLLKSSKVVSVIGSIIGFFLVLVGTIIGSLFGLPYLSFSLILMGFLIGFCFLLRLRTISIACNLKRLLDVIDRDFFEKYNIFCVVQNLEVSQKRLDRLSSCVVNCDRVIEGLTAELEPLEAPEGFLLKEDKTRKLLQFVEQKIRENDDLNLKIIQKKNTLTLIKEERERLITNFLLVEPSINEEVLLRLMLDTEITFKNHSAIIKGTNKISDGLIAEFQKHILILKNDFDSIQDSRKALGMELEKIRDLCPDLQKLQMRFEKLECLRTFIYEEEEKNYQLEIDRLSLKKELLSKHIDVLEVVGDQIITSGGSILREHIRKLDDISHVFPIFTLAEEIELSDYRVARKFVEAASKRIHDALSKQITSVEGISSLEEEKLNQEQRRNLSEGRFFINNTCTVLDCLESNQLFFNSLRFNISDFSEDSVQEVRKKFKNIQEERGFLISLASCQNRGDLSILKDNLNQEIGYLLESIQQLEEQIIRLQISKDNLAKEENVFCSLKGVFSSICHIRDFIARSAHSTVPALQKFNESLNTESLKSLQLRFFQSEIESLKSQLLSESYSEVCISFLDLLGGSDESIWRGCSTVLAYFDLSTKERKIRQELEKMEKALTLSSQDFCKEEAERLKTCLEHDLTSMQGFLKLRGAISEKELTIQCLNDELSELLKTKNRLEEKITEMKNLLQETTMGGL